MSAKVTLPIQHEKNDDKQKREVTLPVDGISVEDWYGVSRTDKVPNKCRVTFQGTNYQVLLSREDLEKALEGLGVKIHRLKAV